MYPFELLEGDEKGVRVLVAARPETGEMVKVRPEFHVIGDERVHHVVQIALELDAALRLQEMVERHRGVFRIAVDVDFLRCRTKNTITVLSAGSESYHGV